MKRVFVIDTEGNIEFIYDDKLHTLIDQGEATITRISSVEPDANGNWVAEMQNGVKLKPCKYREDALKQEIQYINEEILNGRSRG